MYQKTFEVLQAIDDLVTEYYEKIKIDCDTYEDLEKELRGMLWDSPGRLTITYNFLMKAISQKMEEEKSGLRIVKQEKCGR